MSAAEPSLPPILLVDDDEEARDLIRMLLGKGKVANPVIIFCDGHEVIERLKAAGQSTVDRVREACLMLLDVKMPKLGGLEVLAWVRDQSLWKHLVIVMLTTSDDPRDVGRATQLGAHTYLIKYPAADTLAAIVKLAQEAIA